MISGFNGLIDAILPCMITFTSVTFFITFTNAPLLPSYIVIAMVRIKTNIKFDFNSFFKEFLYLRVIVCELAARWDFSLLKEFSF